MPACQTSNWANFSNPAVCNKWKVIFWNFLQFEQICLQAIIIPSYGKASYNFR